MFGNLRTLETLDGIENWNTSKVTSLVSFCDGCTNLKNISAIRKWDVSKVKNVSALFANNPNINNLSPLNDWNDKIPSDVYIDSWTFYSIPENIERPLWVK